MTVAATDTRLDRALAELAAELERWQVPALELAAVQDGNTLHASAVGVGSASTLFHHGSCGKAFTGLLAALLAEDGVVDLDAPVRHYVPELRLPDPVIADRLTLRDLLSHRSGLGRHDLAWILNPSRTGDDWVARLEHLPLAGDLRAQWSYSNFGYVLAGVALGRAAGDDWHALVRKHVFEPLRMSRSLTSEQLAQADSDHAIPHVLRDGRPVATQWRVFDAIAPAGGVISCADDSVRWLLAQLGSGDVSRDAVATTHQGQMLLPAGMAPFPELQLAAYGFGWVTGTYRGRGLVWHNGGVDGFTTQTLLLPEQNIGVVACANQHLTNFPFAVVLHVADALLGEDVGEQSWFERLRPHAPLSPDVPAQPSPSADCAHPVADYAGRYRNAGYGDLVAEVADDVLAVQVGDSDVTASHRHYETWDLRYEPLAADFPVTFLTNANGDVDAVVVDFEPDLQVRFDRVTEGQTR